MTPRPESPAATLRELRPEQYHQGFIAGGYRVPFGPILRITDHGTYVVREPEAVLPRV